MLLEHTQQQAQMNNNNLVYHFPQVIIGGNLASLKYSFIHDIPLVCTSEYTGQEISELSFFLSLMGKIIVPYEKENSFVLDPGTKTLDVVLKNVHLIKINYSNLIIFETPNIVGLPPYREIQNKGECVVYDLISLCNRFGKSVTVKDGDLPPYNIDSEKFMAKVELVEPERIKLKKLKLIKKDVLVTSYLTEEELFLPEYSEAVVCRKIDKWVKDSNLKSEKRYWRSEKQPGVSYYPVYIFNEKREVVFLEKKIYKDTDGITFLSGETTCVDILTDSCYYKVYDEYKKKVNNWKILKKK